VRSDGRRIVRSENGLGHARREEAYRRWSNNIHALTSKRCGTQRVRAVGVLDA